jgi:hypothetical protein
MLWKPLRSKLGIHQHWEIDAAGNIRCTLDPTFQPVFRFSKGKKKYIQAQLMRGRILRWFYLHRLVGYSWLGNPPHVLRFIIDHRNGNCIDNAVENLRWVTITANNMNRQCYGLVEEGGVYYPKIRGFVHRRFGTPDEGLAHDIRGMLVESYIRYNCRFPDSRHGWPHNSIHTY